MKCSECIKNLSVLFSGRRKYLLKIQKSLMNLTCFKNNWSFGVWVTSKINYESILFKFWQFFYIYPFSTLCCIFKEIILVCQKKWWLKFFLIAEISLTIKIFFVVVCVLRSKFDWFQNSQGFIVFDYWQLFWSKSSFLATRMICNRL